MACQFGAQIGVGTTGSRHQHALGLEAAVVEHEEVTRQVVCEFVECPFDAAGGPRTAWSPAHDDGVCVVTACNVEHFLDGAVGDDRSDVDWNVHGFRPLTHLRHQFL